MLGIIIDNIVHPLPATIDAHKSPIVRLYSRNNELTADNDAVVTFITDNIFDVDLSACADASTLTVTNGEETNVITIYNEVVDVTHLVKWLQMQQLGFMVPIMTKVGWHKLKEAALKAKNLMDMQGTEGALKQVLDLLEADNNVKLWRYWFRETDDGEIIAYDNMTATDLAEIGYKLTGELKLTYQQDSLNPWSEQIYDNVMQIVFTLNDIATCIKGILPATLQIKDYELIRMGLGIIQMNMATRQNSMQSSLTEVGMGLVIPDILQYSYEAFVYDLDTKKLIRVAPYKEQNAHGEAMVVLEVQPLAPIYDVKVLIDNVEYVTADELTEKEFYCIKPPVGKHTLSYSYYTETGNLIQKSKQVTILAAETRNDIYEFASPFEAPLSADTVMFIGMQSLLVAWTQISRWCQGNFYAPKSYQVFYVPIENVDALSICGALKTINYHDFNITTEFEDFTISSEIAMLAGDTEPTAYWTLTTKNYAGKYDFTVRYHNIATNQWEYADSLSKYFTMAMQPSWNVRTLSAMVAELNKTTAVVSCNEFYANNGHYMPINSFDADFAKRLQMMHAVYCHCSDDTGNVMLVRAFLNKAKLTMSFGTNSVSVANVVRQPSFGVKVVQCPTVSTPYIAYRQDMFIDLYADDVLVLSGYTYLVFALLPNKKYRLHIHNDWYNKQIQLS